MPTAPPLDLPEFIVVDLDDEEFVIARLMDSHGHADRPVVYRKFAITVTKPAVELLFNALMRHAAALRAGDYHAVHNISPEGLAADEQD